MDFAVETSGLHKTYKRTVEALQPLDLRVPAGSCFGLLGPNGAGKSTLVKTLLSIVRASGGGAQLLGRDFRDPASRRSVGYLPEGHLFPRYLTGRGVCTYFGRLAGLRGAELKRDVEQQLELLEMARWGDTKLAKYSKGMCQRIGLAQAMLGRPRLLFLDEPTDGVDPLGRRKIRGVIRGLVEGGATVFVNSHLLSEVELMCDRVAILYRGRLIRQGTVGEITAPADGEGRRYKFTTGPLDGALRAALGARGEVTDAADGFTLTAADRAQVSAAIDDLREAGVPIYGVEPHRMSLEEVFIHLIGDQEAAL